MDRRSRKEGGDHASTQPDLERRLDRDVDGVSFAGGCTCHQRERPAELPSGFLFLYRVVVCGWDKQKAINEMTGGGFGLHPVWTHIVQFIQELDTAALQRDKHINILSTFFTNRILIHPSP